MTTQQLRFFLEVAECLNFTEAAKRLFVAQSTLSKQIALLEDELGVQLFSRGGRTVSLTPAGTLLRGEFRKITAKLSDAITRAQHLDRGLEGSLSIGVLDLFDPALFLTPLLNLFRARYPKVELNVCRCGFSKLRDGLEREYIDVIFSKGFDLISVPNLNLVNVYRNTPALLLPSHHRLAAESCVYVSQLKDEYFIVLSPDETSASVQTLVDLCGKTGFYPKISKYAESTEDRTYYVSLGYGIAMVDLALPIPRSADLVTVPLRSEADNVFHGIDVMMAWKKSCTNPSVRLLTNLAGELVSPELTT